MIETLLAFYFGWSMGARSGPEGVEELNAAIASLRQSEEFDAVVSALRKHIASIIREVADQFEDTGRGPMGRPDVLAAVYQLIFPEGEPGKGE